MTLMHADVEGPEGASAVVCLHGGIGTGRYHWSQQVEALSARHRVHLPDLPGHGRTPIPEGRPYDVALLTDAVEDYLDTLDAPAHVLAFSMGGYAVLELAARRRELFASVALVGVAIRPHDGLGEWRERFDPDRLAAEYPLWVRALRRLHEPLGEEAWREVCLRDSAGDLTVTADLGLLGELTCPALLVRGDRDSVVPAAHHAELREAWPQADEFVVPAGGHDVQLTRHEIVRPALVDFLQRAEEA